jgi:hypothetical protein
MPSEDKHERINRELIELLNELRVALPGVQTLFAFMLILPFTDRFSSATSTQRLVYFLAFMCATASAGLLIAPSAYHRLMFRQHDKERMLLTANRLAIGGMAFLALAIGGVVFVVTDVLFDTPLAAVIAAVNAGWFGWFWYGLPISRRAEPQPPER